MTKVVLLDVSTIFFPTVMLVDRMRTDIVTKIAKKEFGENYKDHVNFDYFLQLQRQKRLPFINTPRALYFSSLLSMLKKINLNKDDIIIVAGEGSSWRKKVYAPYKGNREAQRKKNQLVDWDYEFKQWNKLHDELKNSTNWYFVRDWNLEADDILAVACRYFSDKEVVLVTIDKDLYQLDWYNHVSLFNAKKKCKGSKGIYEKCDNPLKVIADKARLGDKIDNILVDKKNDTNEDYNLRYEIVNLLELPPDIEQKGIDAINEALKEKKELNLDNLPNFKDVKKRFLQIYDPQYKITPEYCENLLVKRQKQKKKEKK